MPPRWAWGYLGCPRTDLTSLHGWSLASEAVAGRNLSVADTHDRGCIRDDMSRSDSLMLEVGRSQGVEAEHRDSEA